MQRRRRRTLAANDALRRDATRFSQISCMFRFSTDHACMVCAKAVRESTEARRPRTMGKEGKGQ